LRYLLDVNVWIALLDEAHVHHQPVLNFTTQTHLKVDTCQLTENGVG